MESLTYQKNLKISPKKMRMIRDNIYKLSPQAALDFLLYAPTKPANIYYKVLHSAIQNAVSVLKVQAEMLEFKVLTIEEGRKLKRFRAGSKGMAKPFVRKYSHVKVILVEKTVSKSDKKEKKVLVEKDITKEVKKTSTKTVAKKAPSKKLPAKAEKVESKVEKS